MGRVLLCASGLAVILLTWAGVDEAIRTHRSAALAEAGTEAASKSILIGEQLRRQLLTVDQTLRILVRAWQRDPAGFDLSGWSRDVVALNDLALQIFLTDPQGIIRASTRSGLVGNDVSDRDYFRHEAALPADDRRMFMGSLRQGAVTGRWQLNLVRRLDNPDGSFAGIIAVSYDPDTIIRLYGQAELGAHGVVAVISAADGGLRALAGPGQANLAANIGHSSMFAAARADPDGRWTGHSPFDDIERIYAFHEVAGRGLIVAVGFAKQEALAEILSWERSALLLAGCITVLVLVTAAFLFQWDRAAWRREEELARDRAVLTAANAELVMTRAVAQAKAAQLEATLTGMTDGIMMIDADLKLIEWNPHFPEFTGVPAEILRVGLPMEEILRKQARAGEFGTVQVEAEVSRRMARLRSNASSGRTERRRPDGRVLELRRNPLPGGGFVTLYTDVTARRQAEDRLHQSEKLAAVGRATAGAAHDFNNLLSSILGSAELLELRLAGEPELGRYAANIRETAERGGNLIRGLLASSRTQALAPRPADLNALVQGMQDLLQTTVRQDIRLELVLQHGLWPALVDDSQFEHVILNLAVNARDAMPQGGVLTIATANLPRKNAVAYPDLADQDYVTLAVCDTGTGMSDDVLRRASEPFFTTKPEGQGSGLGLSQVHGFAKQSAGAVQIFSQRDKGTTVRVIVPRAAWQGPEPRDGVGR
jgi:signal transduction histidine kinase